jgi:hypothetical protein
MVAIGMGLAFVSYSLGLWGYSLVRGYNLSAKQIISPTGPYTGKWPPPLAGNTVIIPNGSAADVQTTALVLTNPPGNSLAGGAPSAAAGGIANTATIRQVAQGYGWGSGGNWNALTHLIAGESGGNPTIKNQSSGALGIAQALGHGSGCSAGTLGNEYGAEYGLSCAQARAANSGNAVQQLRWMLGYIKAVYGSPAAAYSTWLSRSPHWY